MPINLSLECEHTLLTDPPTTPSTDMHNRRGMKHLDFQEYRSSDLVFKEVYGAATGISNTLLQYGFESVTAIIVQNIQTITAPNTGVVLVTWVDAFSGTEQTTILAPNNFVIIPSPQVYDPVGGTGGLEVVLQNPLEVAAGLYIATIGTCEVI